MVRIYFSKFKAVSNYILDHVFDTFSVSNLLQSASFTKQYTNLMLQVYVVNASIIAKKFKLFPIGLPFCDIFENLKPSIDYNSDHFA